MKKYFERELTTFEHEDIRNLADLMIDDIPDYFFHVPASSTGKYHPTYALGEGGLYRHTCALIRFLNHFFEVENMKNMFTSRERDLIRLAGIMHDSRKSGETDNKSTYTKFEHPILAAEAIRRFKGKIASVSDEEIEYAAGACSSHMGQWNTDKHSKVVLPLPSMMNERILHLADYLASRKDIEILFEDTKTEDISTYHMPFGKYRGKLLAEIAKEDSNYLSWLKVNVELNEPLKSFIEQILS